MTETKPPPGLGAPGRRLWRAVVTDAADVGLELDGRDRFWLTSACKLADRAAVLEVELVDAPLMVKGSTGQMVSNPLMAEWRSHNQLAAQLLARLKLDTDEAAGGLQLIGGNRQRAAANRRWRGNAG